MRTFVPHTFMFGNDKEVITMARRILAAGNWKMNKTPSETKALIAEMAPAVASDEVGMRWKERSTT